MPSPLFGKWKLTKSENFDEYMKQVGVNVALRKAAILVSSSTTEITEEGEGKIRINTQSTLKSSNIVFLLNHEVEEKSMDGRTCKTTLQWQGNDKSTLRQVQTWGKDNRTTTLDLVYEDGGMVIVMECEGVLAKRYHSKC